MTKIIPFDALATADLVVDAVYQSRADGQIAGEPISKLLPGSGNMGGFRVTGRGEQKSWVVLFTTGEDKDWPDTLDLSTGKFVYFGDNKTPGHELHETRGGNKVLRYSFERLHAAVNPRADVAPFLVFKKYPLAHGTRSVQFKGLAVPGFPSLSSTEDLVAVWKSSEGQRFQNYRAVFTILNAPVLSRAWINDLKAGDLNSSNAPRAWRQWRESGKYSPLAAAPTTNIRSANAQSPDTALKRELLECIWQHYKGAPIAFEAFAARVFQMTDERVVIDEITRGVVDGGRDAIGRYRLGSMADPVYAEFSLEAKCYRPPLNGDTPITVSVSDVARLISRIRHRQFGVLVTTSVIASQAYKEVREDRHPIVFISGGDMVNILIDKGYNTRGRVQELLSSDFALVAAASSEPVDKPR